MIEQVVESWHRYIRGEYPGGLDALLADDCVFYSPIVFTPQQGKEITKMYLQAAGASLGGEDAPAGADPKKSGGKFRYVREIVQGRHAMLEFETSVEGRYLNGIDIITCNDEGRISEFKVFVRPLQAIEAVHRQMKAMLEKMSS
jgi:hypothetical protein